MYITDGAYNREQILDMEEEILGTLKFSLNFISPLHFLRRFSKAAQSDYTIHTLCKYIIEISLIDIRLLKYLPSGMSFFHYECISHHERKSTTPHCLLCLLINCSRNCRWCYLLSSCNDSPNSNLEFHFGTLFHLH